MGEARTSADSRKAEACEKVGGRGIGGEKEEEEAGVDLGVEEEVATEAFVVAEEEGGVERDIPLCGDGAFFLEDDGEREVVAREVGETVVVDTEAELKEVSVFVEEEGGEVFEEE